MPEVWPGVFMREKRNQSSDQRRRRRRVGRNLRGCDFVFPDGALCIVAEHLGSHFAPRRARMKREEADAIIAMGGNPFALEHHWQSFASPTPKLDPRRLPR